MELYASIYLPDHERSYQGPSHRDGNLNYERRLLSLVPKKVMLEAGVFANMNYVLENSGVMYSSESEILYTTYIQVKRFACSGLYLQGAISAKDYVAAREQFYAALRSVSNTIEEGTIILYSWHEFIMSFHPCFTVEVIDMIIDEGEGALYCNPIEYEYRYADDVIYDMLCEPYNSYAIYRNSPAWYYQSKELLHRYFPYKSFGDGFDE